MEKMINAIHLSSLLNQNSYKTVWIVLKMEVF